MKTVIRNLAGDTVGEISLPDSIFNVSINKDLFSRYMRYCLLMQRSYTANTKNRSDVAGSGRKRRRQKKSGKARMGESAPHHRGGPIAHAPRVINKHELAQMKSALSTSINKKQKRQVLSMVLSQKLRDGNLIIVNEFSGEPRTKAFRPLESTFGISGHAGAIFVDQSCNMKKISDADCSKKSISDMVSAGDKFCSFYLSARNCHYVKFNSVFTMSVHSILKHKRLIMTEAAVNELFSRYEGGNNE